MEKNKQLINKKINEIIELIPIPKNSTKAERNRLKLALKLKEWEGKLESYLEGDEFIIPQNNLKQNIAIGDNNVQIN